jgi:hypothetical protein
MQHSFQYNIYLQDATMNPKLALRKAMYDPEEKDEDTLQAKALQINVDDVKL